MRAIAFTMRTRGRGGFKGGGGNPPVVVTEVHAGEPFLN